MTCAALGRFRKEEYQSLLLSPRGPQGQETDFRVGFSADVCGERCSWNSPLGTQPSLIPGATSQGWEVGPGACFVPVNLGGVQAPVLLVAPAHARLPHCPALSVKVLGACKHRGALEWGAFTEHFLYGRRTPRKQLPVHISCNPDRPSPYFPGLASLTGVGSAFRMQP